MMRALLICLLVMAQSAIAGVCPGNTGPTLRESLPDEPSVISCAPALMGGTGTRESLRVSAKGIVAWHWCPASGGRWSLVWMAATPSTIASAAADVGSVMVAADKLAALRALADKHNTPIDDATLLPLWCPLWGEMVASAPKPAQQWWVRKAPWNASPVGTRPTFSVLGGNLVSDGGRVLEFAACNCAASKYPASGPTTHCSVLGQTPKLALCEPRP